MQGKNMKISASAIRTTIYPMSHQNIESLERQLLLLVGENWGAQKKEWTEEAKNYHVIVNNKIDLNLIIYQASMFLERSQEYLLTFKLSLFLSYSM